jgi:hypothetical protein
MGDLVFQARVDLLRRNLGIVEGVLTLIEEHFPRDLSPLPSEIKTKLVDSRSKLQEVEQGIDSIADVATMRALQEAREQLRQVLYTLYPIVPVLADSHLVLPDEHDLKDDLVTKAETCTTDLDTLERQAAMGEKSMAELWKEYHNIEVVCQGLFYEYVDLVRGVALRSSRLDQDLCRIADDLVRSVSKKWRSITIPARLERMAPTSGRLIRIGFPEWTIWNVPLAVHEYGHVFAEVVSELHQLLEGQPPADRVLLESLMADAFAAITVGPAYGCAAILTRLDPAAPIRGEPNADHVIQRTSMILAALEAGGPSEEAEGVIDRLRRAWVDAVEGTGYLGPSLVAHDRAEELVQAVGQQCIGRRFLYDRWSDYVTTSANKLLEGSQPGNQPLALEHPNDVDIRHLLNAAWLCRVPPSVDAERVATHADQLGRIADQVRDVGLGWLRTPGAGRESGTGGQQTPDGRSK